jgi:proliferating cell nuclear antigen PCNA
MFEARLEEGVIFKKIVEAIKELVKNVNLDMNGSGISLQAMDSSHVALVALQLNEAGFKRYRCDRNLTMGLSIENLSKILKCAGNDDVHSKYLFVDHHTQDTRRGANCPSVHLRGQEYDCKSINIRG